MKVLHVSPSIGPLRGGPSYAVQVTARALARRGIDIHVATTDDNGAGRLTVPLGHPVVEDSVTIHYFPRQVRFYTVSWSLTRWLARHAADYDLLHIYSLFSYVVIPASVAAAAWNVPYIIEPLGTLNRWGMTERRPLLKRLSLQLCERHIVRGAAAIRFTSDQERTEAAELGLRLREAVIPLGIDLRPFDSQVEPERLLRAYPQLAGRTLILFLSRLDPKKGLDLLLPAFAQVQRRYPETALVVAGDGEAPFVRELKVTAQRLGLSGSVIFTGFLDGDAKHSALAAADLYVLTSRSENFAMAPVEAMAAGLPVILSEHIAISTEVRGSEAGIVVPMEVGAIACAIERLVRDPELRRRSGNNGRRLAGTHFSAEAMGGELLALYERIVEVRHHG